MSLQLLSADRREICRALREKLRGRGADYGGGHLYRQRSSVNTRVSLLSDRGKRHSRWKRLSIQALAGMSCRNKAKETGSNAVLNASPPYISRPLRGSCHY